MKKFCCFAGHGKIYEEGIKEKIINSIEYLYKEKEVKNFLVGNYGAFDLKCASAVKEFKKKCTDVKLELIIPYLSKDIETNSEHYKDFDNIFIPDFPLNTPYKAKIIKTNECMVKESNFLICYINHSFGGAFRTFEYAQKKGLEIINLGNLN